MRLSLLGPVQLTGHDGEVIEVGSPKRRLVLAALGLEAGRVVMVDRLLDLVWDNAPPAHARNALQVHISALRKLLGPDVRLVTRASGYLLDVEPGAIDVGEFRDLVSSAAGESQDMAAAAALQAALRLWRGPALADLVQSPLVESLAAALDEERRGALTALAGRLVRCGRGHEAVAALHTEITEAPLHEPLITALVRCLYQAGRQADAIGAYHAARHRLAGDLGVDPGEALQEAYRMVLAMDDQPSPAARGSAEPGSAAGAARHAGLVPAQLPRAPSGFAGRSAELEWLRQQSHSNRPVIICGPAGAGKTALMLHWAHQVAGQFPDGQLFVRLRGFDPTGPASPDTVLPGLLRALGVAAPDVPAGLEEQAALYRTLTAGRRILVVLDDARSTAQVRPLLPASADSRVIITSRTRLDGLVIHDGALALTLGPLTTPDALSLLDLALRPIMGSADPETALALAGLCDNLPLALSIAAARLLTTPTLTIAALVGQLRDEHRLQALATDDAVIDDPADGDAGVSVAAALSLSYQALPALAARLFTLTGLYPGADLDAYAAAALAGISAADAAQALTALASFHLAYQPVHGRYSFHDLVRLYARGLAGTLPPADADAALARLYDYYLQSTRNANIALRAAVTVTTHPALASPAPEIPVMPDAAAAVSWFDAEEKNIQVLVGAGSHHGHAWRLAYNRAVFGRTTGSTPDMIACLTAGLGAARHTHSTEGQAQLLTRLGVCYSESGRHDEALRCMREARELLGPSPDASDMYFLVCCSMAHAEIAAGNPEAARRHHQEALEVERKLGPASSWHRGFLNSYQAGALNNLAWAYLEQSEPRRALTCSQQAVELTSQSDDRLVHVAALHTHGRVLQDLGQLEQALACYRQALGIAQDLRWRFAIAAACHGIGAVQAELGQFDDSRVNLNVARDLYTAIGNSSGAAEVSAALDQVGNSSGAAEVSAALDQS